MKKYYLFFVIILYSGLCIGNNIDELEKELKLASSPKQQLILLKQKKSIYLDSNMPIRNKYWLLLGLALEENDQLDEALNTYDQSITAMTPFKSTFRELYIKTLIQRSYIKYLQTYDTQYYCPDRKSAFQMVNKSVSIDLQVRVYVQYAFCFQNDKSKLSVGLSLLDKALALAKQHNLSANTHGMIYNASGSIYDRNQMPEKAYNYLLQAYQQWQQVDDYQDMFNMLHSLTHTAVSMLNFELANKHVKQMFALAQQQKAFNDFTFFAYFNAGIVAYAEGKVTQSNIHFAQALKERHNTKETFFIKRTLEQLIINNFHLSNVEKAADYLLLLQSNFPKYETTSSAINAFSNYRDKQYLPAMQLLLKQIDHEIKERRLFVKNAVQATSLLNSQNLIELDKKILQKTIEIQELNLSKEQTDKRSIYLVLVIAIMLFIGLSIFSYYLFKTRKIFKKHARIDYLTGVYNRRYLFEKGEKALVNFASSNRDISLFLIDIDNFKHINDTNGHAAGDIAIKYVVEQCKNKLTDSAIVGRLGGDEFLVILPGYAQAAARKVAETIRLQVCNSHIEAISPLPLSLSIGVVDCKNFGTLDDVIAEADRLLYQAKERGRNIVID
jgi:diguanylate cyclase (GGDEF)-like protein